MAISVRGNEATQGGTPVDTGLADHREAVRAAKAAAEGAKVGRTSATPRDTVYARVALDFDGAEPHVEVVDPDEAMAAAIDAARAEDATSAEIAEIARRDPKELAAELARTCHLKRLDRRSELLGTWYEAGDYYGRYDDGTVLAVTATEYKSRFKRTATSSVAKKSDDGKES